MHGSPGLSKRSNEVDKLAPGVLSFTPARRLIPLNLPGMPVYDVDTDQDDECKEIDFLAECTPTTEMVAGLCAPTSESGSVDLIQLPPRSPRLYVGTKTDIVRV